MELLVVQLLQEGKNLGHLEIVVVGDGERGFAARRRRHHRELLGHLGGASGRGSRRAPHTTQRDAATDGDGGGLPAAQA